MNSRFEKTRTVFGAVGHTPVWAIDGISSGSKAASITIKSGQLVCMLHRAGYLRVLSSRGQPAMIDAGHIVFLRNEPGSTHTIEWGGYEESDLLIFGFDLSVIQGTLQSSREELTEDLLALVFGSGSQFEPVQILMSKLVSERIFSDVRNPPVSGRAVDLWNEGRVREVVALCFYQAPKYEDQFFCTRQKKLAQERVVKTKAFIEANFEEALDLKAAARYVGCSPHYLSRTFSDCEGMTILQFQRKIRIAKAAELLKSGRYNVSEAAIEVGYQSLSHFSKAFQQEKGVLPSRYGAETLD